MFRRICYAVLAGVCISLALRAAAAPRLTLSERAIDLGVVAPWATATATVTIRNSGDEPLHVSRIEASCGCTTFDLSRRDLASGETARLSVSVRPTEAGRVRNQLRIGSNGGTAELQIEASVEDVLGLGNGVIDLGDTATTSLVLRSPFLRVQSSEHVDAVLRDGNLFIGVTSERDGEEQIVLDGEAPLAPIPLTVRWRRGDALIAEPARVVFFGNSDAALTADVTLRRRSGRELRIVAVDGLDERLRADVHERHVLLRYSAAAGERSQRSITVSAGDVRVEIPIVVMAE